MPSPTRLHKHIVMTFFRRLMLLPVIIVSTSALAAGSEAEYWSRVMNAIVQVESNGDTRATNGICAGPMQISPIVVKECNGIMEALKSKTRYTLADRFNLAKSKEMFLLIQSKYNPTRSIEQAVRTWNGGPDYSKKKTDRYYKKVMAEMKKQK